MEKTKWTDVVRRIPSYITLLFLALRACDVISWPWWCVLSPVLIPLAICAVLLVIIAIAEAWKGL